MKKILDEMMKLFVSDNLPFESRIQNIVCFLGALAAIISLIARIVEGMHLISIVMMVFIITAILCLFYVSTKYKGDSTRTTTFVVYALAFVLWPAVFFTNGGADSGMSAYFALILILNFLLLNRIRRIIGIVLSSVAIILCYTTTMFWGWHTWPYGGLTMTQRFVDTLQSIFVAGFFIGTVIHFQNKVYLKEKEKAEAAVAEITRNEELLRLVNEAASILLTIESDKFEDAIEASMEKMAVSLGFDHVYIWRLGEREGNPVYVQIYAWLSPESDKQVTIQSVYGVDWVPRVPEWDAFFEKREYITETTQEFSASAQEHLLSCGVKAFVAFPVFLSDKYWGFLSFDNCHSESLCSQQEAAILQSGSLLLANAVERDIMEKERAAALEQAIQASRAKGDFLSNMSHEMRTPMNAIIGMTSIGMTSHNIEGKDNAFKKIDDASKHLLGVINDILDMSKIEADKLELSPISFNFEKMLQNVVNVINFRVDERHQQFYIMIDKHIPHMLIGDDQRLAQVITNLLSNAVKFTPEEGSIHLDANLLSEEDGQCRVRIDVTDTGIGISEEQKHRLFQSFEQAEAGTSRKFGGTGLGLAISKRIVELMGGEIWVESEQGHGAKFSFTVQLQRDSQSYKRLLADDINWGNIRIFAVDDEPEIREFFLSVSENLGIVCNVAASGEEAAEMLAAHNNYNVYFLDWKLPGMTGIDLARQINANSINKSVVIIFSSTDWSVIEDDARAAGVDKFLPKPLFPSVIVDLINECLGLGYIANEPVKSDDDSLDFSRYTLLLAEDVEINREIVMALFEPTMLTIDCAENGREAVDMFCAAPDKYDMIFMDVQMPEMDGYEATRFIRALDMPVAKTIPIVAMTANVFREDVERCLEAGMNDHVGKPLDFDVILEKLRMYLPK